ncbi:MAG: hypothetical protein KKH98_07280, partial [Spirochaetes bacterium]|nr:hypothetical protein [Spirochaetota bacterium]
MNKITTTVIFVLLILNLSSAPGLFSAENRQKFKITARAEVQEISLNRNFRVIIEISYLGKPGDYNITDPQLEMYHNLVTTGSSSETEVEAPSGQDQGQEVHKRYIFNLKGESLGQAYFPRAHISVNDPKGILLNELTTQPIPITVIEPIKKRDYTPLIIVTLVLGLFTPAVFYIVKQLKKLKEK